MKPYVRPHRIKLLICTAVLPLLFVACGGGSDTPAESSTSTTPGTSTGPSTGSAAGTTSGTGTTTGTTTGSTAGTTTGATSGGTTSAPSTTDIGCGSATFRADVLQMINQRRAVNTACGSVAYLATTATTWDDRLATAAYNHSADMASRNYFSHTSPEGGSASTRTTAAGYAWSAVGENIAAGYPDAAAVVQGWMDSPGHCQNIMSSGFTQIGMACVNNASSDFKRYYTLVLAKP